MTLSLYATCFCIALVGMALQTILKIKSFQDKATAGNVQFKISQYFSTDWLSIVASFLTIILFMLFTSEILKWQPAVINYVKIGFGFIGYTGSDIASRLFSVVNGKINSIISDKANAQDGGSTPVTPLK